jgi:glycosyltransferase involved in cell wall biosynthesis
LIPESILADELPDVVVDIIIGSHIRKNFKGGDGVGIMSPVEGVEQYHLAAADYDLASEVADEILSNLQMPATVSPNEVLTLRKLAVQKLKGRESSERSVAMLKDKASSGWWRMVLPARHMQRDGWTFDCTAAQVKFEHLLEYDTIFVQRIHDWESFYALERLHAAGKRIVYDIDDDLFNITPDNPAYHSITRDDQLAAAECMQMADVVTCTTAELQKRMTSIIEGVNPVVIPNAWDVEGWTPTAACGSPDGFRRILWSGGASHEEDWNVCHEAVMEVMNDPNYSDVRLVIMGYLPPVVTQMPWHDRIEYVGFRHPETYYQMIHHVRAEVALCPLRCTAFNAAKSAIKYLEYSSIGIPTVASNWLPYSAAICEPQQGMLVENMTESWVCAIKAYLDDEQLRRNTIAAARRNCSQFDIRETAKTWANILC